MQEYITESNEKHHLAYPGRVDDTMSEGCLGLLRQGAGVCLGAADVYYALGWSEDRIKRVCGTGGFMKKQSSRMTSQELKIYQTLHLEPMHLDQLLTLTGISMGELMVDLWNLESKKLCRQVSPGTYQKIQ